MNPNDLQRSAIVATLVKECHARKSFCGETMVQKSVFFLQELLGVPLGFDYQLYIYGPFSFELQRHLSSMMADDMIAVRPLEDGSTFEPGEQVAYQEKHAANTIAKHRTAVIGESTALVAEDVDERAHSPGFCEAHVLNALRNFRTASVCVS